MHDAKLFLAGLLHISIDDLERALTATYERKTIPKRSTGVRTLFVPAEPLRLVQRRILKCILYRIKLPNQFHGFRRKRSAVTNAREHLGIWWSRYWLKVDLKNAFPNVKEVRFREFIGAAMNTARDFRAWHRLRITRMLHRRYCRARFAWPNNGCMDCSQIGSRLNALEKNTRIPVLDLRNLFRQIAKANPVFKKRYRAWLNGRSGLSWEQLSFFEEYQSRPKFEELISETLELLVTLTFHKGSLPQGAPSSPYLFNLSLWFSGLVKRLEELSQETRLPETPWNRRFKFTIYADDITFSASRSFNERPFAANDDQRTLKGMILSAIEADGYCQVNPEKIHGSDFKKGYPLVTGLRVTKHRAGLSKKQIRWLRSFIHHAKQNPSPKTEAQLKGWASYVRMIYGVYYAPYDFDRVPRQIRNILT